MSTTVRRLFVLCTLAPLGGVLAVSRPASADDFGPSYYDRATNELVVTMLYGGTNRNHKFTLKWGTCEFDDSGHRLPWVNGQVLDDQFNDAVQEQYRVVARFSLAAMPCPRPAIVTISTAPGFRFELVIPK
ncbi:MAG: hypothetical protein ACREU2_16040 [Steroidobacteraceae bacterium]